MSNITAIKPRVPEQSEWLSPEQVCEIVPGMTVTLLSRMRDAGRGPIYFKPTPRTVIYSRADIEAWVRSTRVTTREQS